MSWWFINRRKNGGSSPFDPYNSCSTVIWFPTKAATNAVLLTSASVESRRVTLFHKKYDVQCPPVKVNETLRGLLIAVHLYFSLFLEKVQNIDNQCLGYVIQDTGYRVFKPSIRLWFRYRIDQYIMPIDWIECRLLRANGSSFRASCKTYSWL